MKLGLIGCGKMGGALIKGAVKAGVIKPEEIFLNDVHLPSAEALAAEIGAQVEQDLQALAEKSDALLLCTKPQHIPEALSQLNRTADSPSLLIISIAAGVTIETLRANSQKEDRLIRAMPNTPAMLGKGAVGYFPTSEASESDLIWVQSFFQSVGIGIKVENEDLIDAVTALSGSGPAYFYSIIESLANGAIALGLPEKDALLLANQTAAGAAAMIAETGLSPEELRVQVSSPGGTTLAGLGALNDAGLDATLKGGVQAAYNRAKELAKLS